MKVKLVERVLTTFKKQNRRIGMNKGKEVFRRILLGTAGVLCLLCIGAIGLFNKTFASSNSVWCDEGAICGTIWDDYHYEIEGECGYSTSNPEWCSCSDTGFLREPALACS